MIPLDLLLAFGSGEFVDFLWLMLLMDVPRYLIAALVLAVIPPKTRLDESTSGELARRTDSRLRVCGIVSCHNEEHTIRACVESMRANGIEQIVVVNDGSTDGTHESAARLGVTLIDLADRVGKPDALNIALPSCGADLVLVADADTTFPPGSLARIIPYFEAGVGGVGFRLHVANEDFSLITRYQAIEYEIIFTAGRRLADAFSILPNVSGAAGLFRRDALVQVGGWDCEVAEDVALAVKLRINGWQLRYAPDAPALTVVPADIIGLLMQRLRWDASVATIWWFKHRAALLNPFSKHFSTTNLFTALDVLVFNALIPLILPVYLIWLFGKINTSALILLGAVMIALAVVDILILLLVRTPLRLLPYVPFFIVVETLVMRPLRALALIAEAAFSVTRYDPYLPKEQRGRLT
jgi:cellulose synthase/poly-beta-1,6-N-acetylglucosamine synthase-like glycosyltransferase